MDVFIKSLIDYGALGLLSGVLLWELHFLQNKIISTLEKNTAAFNDLKSIIEKCTYKHDK